MWMLERFRFSTKQHRMYVFMCGHHTYSKSMDQPGKVANVLLVVS